MLELATIEDHPVVVTIVNRAYRGPGDDRGWNSEADLVSGDRVTLSRLRQDLADSPQARLLVHRGAGGEVLASVWVEPEDAHNWYFGMLAVSPAAQAGGTGKRMLEAIDTYVRLAVSPAAQAGGTGKRMLEAIDTYVRENGGRRLRITVINVRDQLIAWYERRGFVRTGEIESLPEGIGQPLRDDMNFVILAKDLS